MKHWTRPAPCKVNLSLDILGRRDDGYHDMYMVMQTVSLCDTVTVEERGEGFVLRAQGIILPEGKKSLEQQAAERFFAHIGQAASFRDAGKAHARLRRPGRRQRGCGGAAAYPP